MTNLITYKRKNKMFAWKTIELFASDLPHPYTIKATGDKESFYLAVYDSIDEALEAMQLLQDEVKNGL